MKKVTLNKIMYSWHKLLYLKQFCSFMYLPWIIKYCIFSYGLHYIMKIKLSEQFFKIVFYG